MTKEEYNNILDNMMKLERKNAMLMKENKNLKKENEKLKKKLEVKNDNK